MPKIRAIAEIASKWVEVTTGRANDYRKGIESPKKDWATETKAAEAAYEAGISDAIARKAFGKGVAKAGTEKWRAKALEVGVGRWPAGVRIAEDNYAKGFGPYRDVIERTTLPPRGPKGSPENIERVRVMAMALHEAKIKA